MREGNLAQPQLTVENRLANKRKHVVLMPDLGIANAALSQLSYVPTITS